MGPAFIWKIFDKPLVPVAGTVDLAPLLVMVALLAAGAGLMRLRPDPRRQWLRRLTQASATFAFVIGLHPCACMVRDLLRGFSCINYNNVDAFLFMMLIIPVTAFAMVWGRVFCGWVCPIGFIQELAGNLTRWTRRVRDRKAVQWARFGTAAALLAGTMAAYAFIRPDNEPLLQGVSAGYLMVLSILILLSVADRRWEVRLRQVRYAALAFFVLGTVLSIHLQAAFCVLFTNDLQYTMLLLFAGVLVAALILSSAWCRFLCPEGALLGLLTRLSGWKIRLDRSKCCRCNACGQVCPVEAIEVGEVDERSCLYCCRCVDACPSWALDMGGESPETRSAGLAAQCRGRSDSQATRVEPGPLPCPTRSPGSDSSVSPEASH
jgi:polyferredoxin